MILELNYGRFPSEFLKYRNISLLTSFRRYQNEILPNLSTVIKINTFFGKQWFILRKKKEQDTGALYLWRSSLKTQTVTQTGKFQNFRSVVPAICIVTNQNALSMSIMEEKRRKLARQYFGTSIPTTMPLSRWDNYARGGLSSMVDFETISIRWKRSKGLKQKGHKNAQSQHKSGFVEKKVQKYYLLMATSRSGSRELLFSLYPRTYVRKRYVNFPK